jgi:hypothetical protein
MEHFARMSNLNYGSTELASAARCLIILFYFVNVMLGSNNNHNVLQCRIILNSEASVLEFLSDFQHGRQAFFREFSTMSKKK